MISRRFLPHLPTPPILLVLALLAMAPWAGAEPGSAAGRDWEAVLALDSGPTEPASSREQARAQGLAFLDRQEATLTRFIRQHPRDPRTVDARLRLAHLYAMRGDFTETQAHYDASLRLLDEMENNVPENRRADVAFSRLSLSMRGILLPSDKDRDELTKAMNRFRRQYPNDRRTAALLTEVASLYDKQPRQKERYLNEAMQAARTPEMRARIADDLRRLSLLGRPIRFQGTTAGGKTISTEALKGKVVILYFMASWSPPSILGIEEVNYLRATFPEDRVAVLGVSLDSTSEALTSMQDRVQGGWPVIWEKEGWQSAAVRKLGINALPMLWIIDRKGNLRTLNARTESESLVRALLRER